MSVPVSQRPLVVLAPDSFKGTFDAATVAGLLAQGVVDAGCRVDVCPVADGGEGTVEVLQRALGGRRIEVTVRGSLGTPVSAGFVLTDDGRALIETAAANGLTLIPAGERDAERADSYGTGQLIGVAVAAGAREVLLGVGGSATTDGGAGALRAIEDAGGLHGVPITVLCDVDVPYLDAARMFAGQKGADVAAVGRLVHRLDALAAVLPRDPRAEPRTGSAGGLAGGLWAALGASLVSGIDAVLDAVEFDRRCAGAAAVVTGEGRLDAQSLRGKVLAGIARRRPGDVPLFVVAGSCFLSAAEIQAAGIAGVIEAGTPDQLRTAGATIGRGLRGPDATMVRT